MKKTKATIIIDGSNFYYKLKDLKVKKPSAFSYSDFVTFLAKNTNIQSKYYCIGKIRAKQNDQKARTMMAKQQSLVTKLQKQGFIIQFGYLLKSDNHYHEKGVDIQIAVNILKGAYKNLYDHAFLVSSDTDLIPAIAEAQSVGKTIEYVGFHHKPSYALLKTCKKSRLLTRDDLLPFVKK